MKKHNRKRKILTMITSFIVLMLIMIVTKTTPALAFGGEFTFKDPVNDGSYTKENHTQISTSFDSSGNLIVDGYSFFTYVQHYTTKGTTHSYRLMIIDGSGNAVATFNDILAASSSQNYTNVAVDSTYGSPIAASTTYYCKSTEEHNTQLQQVSFRFTIPASTLASLTPNVEYRLSLECNLNNIRYSGSKSTYSQTVNVTKLVNTDFLKGENTSKEITTSTSKTQVSVYSPGFTTVRVNAQRVVARNSSLSKVTDFQNGYFVKYNDNTGQRNVLRKVANVSYVYDSSLSRDLIGATYVPMTCTYVKNSTERVQLTLDELFAKNPSLKTQYNNYQTNAQQAKNQMDYLVGLARHCTSAKHGRTGVASAVGTLGFNPCGFCLNNLTSSGKNYDQWRLIYESSLNGMAVIEEQCSTTSTSSSNVTQNLYCKAIYLEAQNGKDYYTAIKTVRTAEQVEVISQIIKEKVNSTQLESAYKTGQSLYFIANLNSDTSYNYSSASSKAGSIFGYHIDYMVDNYSNLKSYPTALPTTRSLKVRAGSFPSGNKIYVTYVWRNNAPTIKGK